MVNIETDSSMVMRPSSLPFLMIMAHMVLLAPFLLPVTLGWISPSSFWMAIAFANVVAVAGGLVSLFYLVVAAAVLGGAGNELGPIDAGMRRRHSLDMLDMAAILLVCTAVLRALAGH